MDSALATSIGLEPADIRKLMADIGFVPAGETWKWRGHRRKPAHPKKRGHKPQRQPRSNAFTEAFKDLKR